MRVRKKVNDMGAKLKQPKQQQRITIGSRVRWRAELNRNWLGTVRGAAYMKDGKRYIRVEWDDGDEMIMRETELKLVRGRKGAGVA